ncbi:conserved hypothetical protein [uncultured Desulfobacterium sp.]|uniref:DUF444 family protein n=1 Tax=uncultured Desulfobacterium sp. TaxID=201089 RepID=A0A445N078_9BACT|nr:conserved hypothetical protein [uncultured Desulfobacterium sp.]
MDSRLQDYFRKIKEAGLTAEQEEKILLELNFQGDHDISYDPVNVAVPPVSGSEDMGRNLYQYDDMSVLQDMGPVKSPYINCLSSVDDLLERDKKREEDGFPRKIRVGRLIKPGKGGKEKIVVVPTTVEEKFLHDIIRPPKEEGESGGSGEGEEGDVIAEQPVREQEGSGAGPGSGDGAAHEMESSAYDLGRILTEQFELPNLKDKGKKRSLTRYTYDMTDRHQGFGQLLDKKATLRKLIETNVALGNVPEGELIDTTRFLISPSDRIYRVLSREMDYESQAMVFFLRDYSGSMAGKATELVVSQHVLIYSWILYQYARQVETRFILHDTEAKEVPDFYVYYNSKVAGGTKVASSYRLVNEIVEKENIAQDYNIYIFHGTDGDDWDTEGKETIPELKKMLTYASRVGITIAQSSTGSGNKTEVEKYLRSSGLLNEKPDLFRMDVIQDNADEPRLIEGIKKLGHRTFVWVTPICCGHALMTWNAAGFLLG